jgi:radical SAM superfamily enzyme YgiQ (UPF0313 family)
VNFSSYPSSIEFLTPDNGLAVLAGTLIASGHFTRIIDYCTISTMRRFMPPDIAGEVSANYTEYVAAGADREAAIGPLERLLELDKALDAHRSREIDLIADELADTAEELHVDFVGFKLWTGDGFLASIRLAARLKERLPHITIIGGGPHVDLFGTEILNHTDAFDMVVQGEGEPAIVALAEAIVSGEGLAEVPNLIYREDGLIKVHDTQRPENLDLLAEAVYDPEVYPAIAGDEKLMLFMVDESRGCPNRCAFCVHPAKSGGFWRVRSAEATVGAMRRLNDDLGVRGFRLAGSNTPGTLKNEIARELLSYECDFKYAAFGHVRDHDTDFDLLAKSGCVALFFGVESGDETILKRMNKRTRPEHVRETIPLAQDAGIATVISLIAGTPGETQESLQASADLLFELKPEACQITLPYVIPGSLWWEHPERYGIELAENAREKIMTLSLKWMLPMDLWEEVPPYSIDGKSFRKLAVQAGWLTAQAEEAGANPGLTENGLVIGACLGLTPSEARELDRRSFGEGDVDAAAQSVAAFNAWSRGTTTNQTV